MLCSFSFVTESTSTYQEHFVHSSKSKVARMQLILLCRTDLNWHVCFSPFMAKANLPWEPMTRPQSLFPQSDQIRAQPTRLLQPSKWNNEAYNIISRRGKMALPWPITWSFSDLTKLKSWTQNSMYRSACNQPCLELVNKQTVNEKYWNAQVALYKRASWYSPVSNLLTRGTTAPTHLSTILPLNVQEVSKSTNVCKFLLELWIWNMIIQTNNNIRRILVYSTFYRKVKMQLDFFLRDTLPCFASYSLTNFCLLALRDDIQSPREEQECERDCAGLCPTPQFLFCHRVPARPFCATTGGPSPSPGC